MKTSSALLKAKQILKEAEIATPSLDSIILLCFVKKLSKEAIIFNDNLELTQKEEEQFFNLISRRKNGEPVSHLINNREFFGLDFFVNKDVLDPRCDSEILIETIIKNYQQKTELKFLELGVGSGCLSISLLKNLENSDAIGVDISAPALEIAKKNAENHAVLTRFELRKSDLFSAINCDEKFDFIISNPPYIPSKDIENLQIEVKNFEPLLALDGGVDGLEFYRAIAKNSKEFLKENGKIFLEIGINQEKDIEKIFNEFSFKLIAAKKDLAGIIRLLYFG